MDNNVKKNIIAILEKTFVAIDDCYGANNELKKEKNFNKENTRLLFPCLYEAETETEKEKEKEETKIKKKETRISEQELRFLFIEQFNKYCDDPLNNWDAYYSIETPTKWKYKFSVENNPPTPHRVKEEEGEVGGQSAMIDVCIHDNRGDRICLIEFKFGNPEKFCFEKDIVKLEEEGVLGFFVHLLKSQNGDTLPSVLGKIKDIRKSENEAEPVDFTKINYICHTLPKENGQSGKTEYVADNDDEFKDSGWDRKQLSNPDIKKQIEDYKKKIENRKKRNQ